MGAVARFWCLVEERMGEGGREGGGLVSNRFFLISYVLEGRRKGGRLETCLDTSRVPRLRVGGVEGRREARDVF